ncbi:hypothetical protein OG909_30685 [Streptomyces sp. NBC_01754]|uniref:hypothetical protein n=1 Tax=Streptomyces sp. NBC_01754 TaxID=2975930 RepID=UPI002DDA20F9|nr:hypothetical protein [Streptomyces sp. NBC_01754]WSC96317.1 hypothetical protein OG909_30685 [Streptomyces sp. NBC_01754]
MRPEDHEETGGARLLVPMAWMYAEYVADGLLGTGDLMEPATPEYRAGRDALALTLFLSEGPVADAMPAARVDELRLLTACGAGWRRWVRARLDARRRAADRGADADPDLTLACAAWRWLEETELLAADIEAIGTPSPDRTGYADDGETRVWTPAWQLGLPLGHLAVQLY